MAVRDARYEFVDKFIDNRQAYLVKEYAAKFPACVTLRMIGVSDPDYAKVCGGRRNWRTPSTAPAAGPSPTSTPAGPHTRPASGGCTLGMKGFYLPYYIVDRAVAIANDSDYGLHGAVFTADQDRAFQIGVRIRTGTFTVKDFTLNFDAPPGGIKASGIRDYDHVRGL